MGSGNHPRYITKFILSFSGFSKPISETMHFGTCIDINYFYYEMRHYATILKVASTRPRLGQWIFSIYVILPASLSPGVYSASNRNEYQKQKTIFLGSRARPTHKADNLTAIC
jgi:hypothetical protein